MIRTVSINENLQTRSGERGAALATAILMLALLTAITMTVLAVVHTETRIAGSDLDRTRTFYAASAGIEKMTSDFSALFSRTSRPTLAQLAQIANSPPAELTAEGFTFTPPQAIQLDPGAPTGRVTMPSGPFVGLVASVAPYVLTTTANSRNGSQVVMRRQINNYLIPIFQFGMFSNEDLELHPGPQFTFNGRVHANGNLYVNGATTFVAKVTTANEAVTDVTRNGTARAGTVSFQIGAINVPMTVGSVSQGPNLPGATVGQRGYFPGSPNGTNNPNWKTLSVSAVTSGLSDRFAGQILTRTTGVSPLLLPLQLDGDQTREIIKRRMPNDATTLNESRYHTKATIRILLDDETPAQADASGIPAGQGVRLSQFDPIPLPNAAVGAGGGRALWRVRDDGTYNEQTVAPKTFVMQQNAGAPTQALTVRGIKGATQNVTLNGTPTKIPAGSGVTGRILIQIIDVNGNVFDVTQTILSMGMTEGEPNAIVQLQRPLWAAFTQGQRDSSGLINPALNGDPVYTNCLTDLMNKTHVGADGEIKITGGVPVQDATWGYLTNIIDDTANGAQPQRSDTPDVAGGWNSVVPINVYNVREGRISSTLNDNTVYERGITSIVQLNMRNLARWLDGVYDTNLLLNTSAVSNNVNPADGGYIVYVSDRRGDRVKSERDSSGATINTSNGMADNEDIYGPNNALDPGEDVIDYLSDGAGTPKKGTLQKDTLELPDPAPLAGTSGADFAARTARAKTVGAWLDPQNYFRRAVRLFNGESLQVTGAANKLSTTKGITVSSENMLYLWGSYNTTGINGQPANGATLNDCTLPTCYQGAQVPASLVVDALFPLSKTFFDAEMAMWPDSLDRRPADRGLPGVTSETSVRAGLIAGNNLSALAGSPDAGNSASGESRLNGGMHNFPRFLEDWNAQRWNFVGSLIPLYHSTQAMGPYNADSSIYSPPTRNWAFDVTFQDPTRLPPGTPQFQYIEPTGFRQVL